MDLNDLIDHPPREDAPVDLVGPVMRRLPVRTRGGAPQRAFTHVALACAVAIGLILGQMLQVPVGTFPALPGALAGALAWPHVPELHALDVAVAAALALALTLVFARRRLA